MVIFIFYLINRSGLVGIFVITVIKKPPERYTTYYTIHKLYVV